MSSSSSIHLRNQESPTRWQDLPEVCWELVFDRLKHHLHHHQDQDLHRRPDRHLESVFLVCKQFLSISNRLRSSLSIIDPLILHSSSSSVVVVLQRFHHLNRIDLVQFHGDLDFILTEIAQSGLNHLQALDISHQKKFPEKGLKELGRGGGGSSLKILICSRLDDYLLDEHLMVIADAFPYLEELNISYPMENITYPREAEDPFFTPPLPKLHISDAGIVNLSSKLPYLRKLNISGINGLMLYSSLLAISSNCVFLTHISANHYIFLSQGDSPSIFYITHRLISLTITNGLKNGLKQPRYVYNGLLSRSRSQPRPRPLPQPPLKTFESSLVSSRNLRVLDFSDMIISDEFLFSVSQVAFPLKKLALSRCLGFTINGIESILCAYYRSLKHLDLRDSKFLTDQSVSDLSSSGYMHDLNFIGLDSCRRLTNSTFFILARNCPSLQEIRMEGTSLGEDGLIPTEEEEFLGKQNLAIRVLKFRFNCNLNDKTLEKIGYVCPKLESLDVSACMNITEHGIHEIGKRCSEIRELIMVGCHQICDFLVTHNSSEFSKLEDLDAASSGISNGGLSKVGCNCIGLQRLVLNGCLQVTEKGVMEVVNKCKRLKELNLRHCSITSDASLSLIVFSRPSLRKIIPPYGIISDEQKDSFLRHGCMACDVLIRSEILK